MDRIDLIEKLSRAPSGRHCAFVDLENGTGIKVYIHKSMRDRCFEWQSQAAILNMAPIALEKVEFGGFYCYITETAEVDFDIACTDEFDRETKEYQQRFQELFGFSLTDGCWFNYGYIVRDYEKKLVFIDWDIAESCGLPEEIREEIDKNGRGPQDWADDYGCTTSYNACKNKESD